MIPRIIPTALLIVAVNCGVYGENIILHAKETLTVVELNRGDRVDFTLSSGRNVSFELLDSRVDILFTSLDTMKKAKAGEASVFSMTCRVKIDGQIMEMVRYIPVEETYYKPYVVNGLNIWFDALSELRKYFTENHGQCLPAMEARFAFHEAGTQICPQELSNWWPETDNQVFVKDSYMGEDSWLGSYFGAELHGGLDVNMPSNTPMIAPIDFDEHYLVNSVETGSNNNRWRGVRYWENGDIWYLRTAHINELVVPQYKPLKQGEVFAHGAGTWCWYSPHSHFGFKTYQANLDKWILMDPWVILWQIFENNRRKANDIFAVIEPLAPARTGEKVHFSSKGSRPSIYGGEFELFWDFGDGYSSFAENPVHTFLEPGIYPVTLIVRNGYSTDSYTQHITINGEAVHVTSFRITSEEEPSFRVRPAWKTSAYGTCLDIVNTVVFRTYQDSKERPAAKTVSIWFNKSGDQDNSNYSDDLSSKPEAFLPVYKHGDGWLEIEKIPFKDHVDLKLRPIMDNIIVKWGFYEAFIMIGDDEAVNKPQYIRVLVDISFDSPKPTVIIDNLDATCTRSDYFWLALPHHSSIARGYNGNYFISSGNRKGEFIRYTPNLEGGTYEVTLHGKAYENPKLMSKTGSFEVTVHHAGGMDRIRVDPATSLYIGEYHFNKGREGYVEIHSGGSEGMVLADGVKFEKKE